MNTGRSKPLIENVNQKDRPLKLLPFIALAAALLASAAGAQTAEDPIVEAQVLLDRAFHSPGTIDGMMGGNTRRAIRAFERAQGLPVDGELDEAVVARLRSMSSGPLVETYEIQAADVADLVTVPSTMEAQAELPNLGFETAREALAEKFHMSQSFLASLNPGADFAAGTTIRVVRPGTTSLSAKVARVEIDTGASELRALDAEGRLVASYPASIGSARFPSPSGSMEVRAIAATPKYYFDPSGRDWGPDKALTIAAGPNNPVGSTWIDLTKEGYGIHGTPDPRLIGKTSSHGCVRLTNWDAAELSRAVAAGTVVVFV